MTKDWDKIFKLGLKHDYIIVPIDASLNDNLSKIKDYKKIYSDGRNVLYVAKDKLKKQYILPIEDEKYYVDNAFTTSVLFVVK